MGLSMILALLGVALLALAPGPAFMVQAPSKIEEIPVVQGAVTAPERVSGGGEVRRDYIVMKPIQEVVAFYSQRLGAPPVSSEKEPGRFEFTWLRDTKDGAFFFGVVIVEEPAHGVAQAGDRPRTRITISRAQGVRPA